MQLSAQIRIASYLFSSFAAVLLYSFPLYAAANETGYTFRSTANEVRLVFAVSDRQGNAIKTLHSSDVAVVDNGLIVRHFRSFRPASETRIDLLILLDSSDSVASQFSAEISEIESFVADSIWGEWDKVSIMAIDGLRPQLLCERKCNGEAAQMKLKALRAGGATPLYDALCQAAEILKENRDPESRQAMIVFSDGVDTISMHSALDATQAAQNLQAAIYSVNSRSMHSAPGAGDDVLDYLATSTGGLSFNPRQDVAAVLRMVLEDMHSGYVLTYALPEQSVVQHSVQILPRSDPKLQFRSRQGYVDASDQ